MNKHSRFALALLACTGAVAFATGAHAQQTPPPGPADQPAASSEEVVVTGSQVIRNGNQSPTPVTVVPAQQLLELQPTTLSDAINKMPQFGGSQTSASGPGSGVRNGAAAFITLRNAGDNHTLVLYDGHRLPPAEGQASHASDVDLNLIPQFLIKRVDIVTGGAGAVYGSDAISGVVNLITDTNFNGLKFSASQGLSSRGDGPSHDAEIAWGRSVFNNRGHIELSYEYRDDDGILDYRDKFDRPFFAGIYGGGGAGTAASPFISVPNARLASASFGGKIVSATGTIASLNNLNFGQDSVLSPFNVATDGAYFRNSTIKANLGWNKFFGRYDFDLTPTAHAYLQYGRTHEITENFFQPPNLSFNVGLNNPFLDTATVSSPSMTTAQFQALRTANPNSSFRMSEFLVNQENEAGPIRTTVDYQMLLGGVEGHIGDYDWNIHGGHSVNDMDIVNFSNVDVGRFLAAVDTVRDGSGNIVCRAAQTNPTYAGCVPYNPFGPTAANLAAYNYITHPSVGTTHMVLDELQASVSGSPFSTWAGPVDIAVSSEWHRTRYSLHSTTTTFDTIDCTGMRFATLTGAAVTGNCNGPLTTNPTAEWSGNVLNNLPKAEISVFESAVEAQVPLLRDVPLAKSLELNAAIRYTNYSTSGVAWPWKVGLIWALTDDFRIRATRSHDIRAPNLFELFAPQQVAVQNFTDFVVNGVGTTQTGSVPLVTTGDPTITPEIANTITAGFVWEPHSLHGFSMSLDAWRMKMDNTIFQVRAIDQFVRDACINSGGTSPYCAFYVRPTPTSFPTKLIAVNRNIASQDTYGVDFESSYATEVFHHGFDTRLLISWQPHNIFNTGTGTILDIAGAFNNLPANVAPSPNLRATLLMDFDVTDSFRISLLEKWRSGFNATSDVTPGPKAIYAVNHIPSIAYTNLTATYSFDKFGSHVELFGNVQNLFDEYPDPAPMPTLATPSRGINPMAIGDDPVGRYFVVGLRMHM